MKDNIHIFLLTCGEKQTFDTALALVNKTPEPYSMTIWVNQVEGKDIDDSFVQTLLTITDDVIVCTKNKGMSQSMGYILLNSQSPFIVLSGADTMPQEGYFERLFQPFKDYPKMAIAGEAYRKLDKEYVVDDPERLGDYIHLVSKKAINEIGGICPSFDIYGHESLEFQRRIMRSGWSCASVANVCEHTEPKHEISDLLEKDILKKNCDLLQRLDIKEYTGYNWWRNDL